jgi:hypothetical protein
MLRDTPSKLRWIVAWACLLVNSSILYATFFASGNSLTISWFVLCVLIAWTYNLWLLPDMIARQDDLVARRLLAVILVCWLIGTTNALITGIWW